jgi:integrase
MGVRIKSSNGRLQLVATWQGRRQYLSLGLADTKQNRYIAQLKAAAIESDILYERFTGMAAYRDADTPKPEDTPPVTWEGLWDRYVDSKRAVCKPSTMAAEYRMFSRLLKQCPHGWDAPLKVRDWAIKHYSHEMARRWIAALIACCEWGVKLRLIDANPFEGLNLSRAKSKKVAIEPLTAIERDAIIAAIANDPVYGHYANFARFLFYTGCRPSEAIGLEWGHVKNGYINFVQAVTLNEQGQRRVSVGLKTQPSRQVPINARLQAVIDGQNTATKYVFCGVRGKAINWPNFAQKAWPKALAECGISKRKPYNTRHTFATLALRSGMAVADLAKIMGNSPGVIYSHYAGASRDLMLPDV